MEMFGQVDLRATCPPDKRRFFVISSPDFKFCLETPTLHVPRLNKNVLEVPSGHSMWQIVLNMLARVLRKREKDHHFSNPG